MYFKNLNTKNTIVVAIAMLFILLFVYASVSKLITFTDFQTQLGQSPLLAAFAVPVSYGVIGVELITSFLLAFEKTRKWGLYLSFLLMVMFTTYIIIILNFTPFTPCSCGGVLESLGWTEHLVFNVGFIVFALLALYCTEKVTSKQLIIKSTALTLIGFAIVCGLYLTSEKEIKRNNAFIRKYIPHPITKFGDYNLEFNSYYLAGMDDQNIFLGNVTAPFLLKSISHSLKDSQEHSLKIDSLNIRFKRVRIAVNPPFYYVADGTVPVMFRGDIGDWKAKIYTYNEAFFSDFAIADSSNIGFTTISSETRSKALGVMKKTLHKDTIRINTNILNATPDTKFSTDGILLWNEKHQKFLYTYYYKNLYLVADELWNNIQIGKTIDTISIPNIDVQYYKSKDVFKRGKSVQVNRQASTSGDYLYINSDRLGKYESEAPLVSASIIDVYNIVDFSYVFSFYIYHQPHKKIREFKVYKDVLCALVDDKIWLYKLKPKHFNNPKK